MGSEQYACACAGAGSRRDPGVVHDGDRVLDERVEIDPIDGQDARARAVRLDIPAEPLEALLWTLAHDFADPRP